MWLSRIKETFHNLLNARWHVPKPGMVDPVPSSIRGKGKVSYGIFVEFVIELEEDAKTGVCKNGMCRFGENVII
jgi:hypothetical protein